MTANRAFTRYDGLLAAMPASVAGGTVAGWWLTIPRLGLGVGGLIAAVLVVLSLFMLSPQ